MSDERPWLSLLDLPIGDHRETVFELRNGEREVAGYWTGSIWAHVPVTPDPRPIEFTPLQYRPIVESADDVATVTPRALPAGEYAIVEMFGHVKLVGRMAETERFGTKMLALEPIFAGQLLSPVMIGGASIYCLTPCSAEVALAKAPTREWALPDSVRAVIPAALLPSPEFAPRFLNDRVERDPSPFDNDVEDEMPF